MTRNTDNDSLTLQELFFGLSSSVRDFLEDRNLRKCRPATLLFYRNELGYFLFFARVLQLNSLTDITPQVLRVYFTRLGETRRTANSIHCAYRAIKTWLKWSWEEYEIDGRCPMDRIEVESPDDSPRPGIPLADVEKLIEATAKGKNQKRDTALFLFFLDTGIRRAELVRLNVGDVGQDGSVILQGTATKNKVPRKVFLVAETRRALVSYLRSRGSLNPEDPLFATSRGRRCTPEGIYQVLRRRIKNANIDPVGYHAFRRTFALESRRAGAGEIETSRLLGHGKNRGDLSETRRYLDYFDDDLRAAHEQSSPVKKLQRSKGGKHAKR